MKNPHHVSLRVHFDASSLYDLDAVPNKDSHWIPQKILTPSDKWQNLMHFGFSGIMVDIDELIAVLEALPSTLGSLELSFRSSRATPPERSTISWKL